MRLFQPLQVLQAGQVLLAVDHPLDLLELSQQIVAAKLDLLARTTGTNGIGINRHDRPTWVEGETDNDNSAADPQTIDRTKWPAA